MLDQAQIVQADNTMIELAYTTGSIMLSPKDTVRFMQKLADGFKVYLEGCPTLGLRLCYPDHATVDIGDLDYMEESGYQDVNCFIPVGYDCEDGEYDPQTLYHGLGNRNVYISVDLSEIITPDMAQELVNSYQQDPKALSIPLDVMPAYKGELAEMVTESLAALTVEIH